MIKVSAPKGSGAEPGTSGEGKRKGARAAAAHGTVKVSFVLPVSETPDPVSVCGDFNGWDPHAHPLKKRANGTRSASVELAPGRYAFKYLSGGTWFTDPEAHSREVNEYGETNSIIEV